MGTVGFDTGIKDKHGNPIHIGDELRFDEREWGGPCIFTVGFVDGELTGCGSIGDWSEWCEVVQK
jgi:hypothetical protein